jgi:hypothetical protein
MSTTYLRSRLLRLFLAIVPGKASAVSAPALPPARRAPKAATLAGVPIRILESERLGSGALLRDWLLHQPSGSDG